MSTDSVVTWSADVPAAASSPQRRAADSAQPTPPPERKPSLRRMSVVAAAQKKKQQHIKLKFLLDGTSNLDTLHLNSKPEVSAALRILYIFG